MFKSVRILVKIIKGNTLGKTLNAHAEMPFIQAFMNFNGEVIIIAIIINKKRVKTSFIFFKKPPRKFDINLKNMIYLICLKNNAIRV